MASNPWEEAAEAVATMVLHSFGRGTPEEGMKASAILFIITFSSNFVGLVFTIVLDVLFAFLFVVHLLRFVWGSR